MTPGVNLTYSDLFDRQPTMAELIELIQQVPLRHAAWTLARINMALRYVLQVNERENFGQVQKILIEAHMDDQALGLLRTRFVVWWHKASRRFVPGLYCPDIVTALYALAIWSTGTAGGWAICPKCQRDFVRKHPNQIYCKPPCQASAGMMRLRRKRKGSPRASKVGRPNATTRN